MKPVYLGVDLGGTNILAATVDDDGCVLARAKEDVSLSDGIEGVASQMASLAVAALNKADLEWDAN